MNDDRTRDPISSPLISDLAEHRADLGVRPFFFRHRLGEDPRFARDTLGDLVARLPCAWVLAHEAQHSPLERRGKDPLADDADLYAAGLSSHATVNLMLALEEAFDVELPDRLLKRKTFSSINAIAEALAEIGVKADAA